MSETDLALSTTSPTSMGDIENNEDTSVSRGAISTTTGKKRHNSNIVGYPGILRGENASKYFYSCAAEDGYVVIRKYNRGKPRVLKTFETNVVANTKKCTYYVSKDKDPKTGAAFSFYQDCRRKRGKSKKKRSTRKRGSSKKKRRSRR